MLGSLHDSLQTPDRVEGDHIFCSDWQMIITPKIEQVDEGGAVVNFYISAPQWEKNLFECSAGMGSDTKQALGMACGSFLFSFMDGIVQMESGQAGESLETEFAGRTHRWKVYLSDIVGMGNCPQVDNPHIYWDALKEEVVKGLGNQKLCFVKVYASKSGENITAECRVDDIKSEILSNLVADMVKSWDAGYFASHKAFFFIRQEEEMVQPYPYLGQAGWDALREKVRTAALMFHASYSVICQAKEKGGENAMEGGTLSALLFNVGSDFEIR